MVTEQRQDEQPPPGDAAALAAVNPALQAEILKRKRAEQVARWQTEALAKTLNLLAAEPALDKVVGQVLQALTEQLGARSGSFWLYDASQDTTLLYLEYDEEQIHTTAHWQQTDLGADLPHTSQAPQKQQEPFRSQMIEVYDDIAQAPFQESYRKDLLAKGIRTVLVVPLLSGHAFIGHFILLDTVHRQYRPEELELAQALAQQAVLALQWTRLAEQSRQAAVLAERNRIAREIHDTLAQVFTGILLQLRVARRIVQQQPEEAWSLIEHVGELAQQGLAEARRSVWALQPEALEYSDLVRTLSRTVERMASETAAQMELHIHGTPRALPPDVGMNLLRIGQEALSNALQHGQARIVWIELTFEAERVYLRVQDDGQGFDLTHQADGGGFGLIVMGQRAWRLGGQLTIASQPGRGTEVAVSVPVAAGQCREEER